MAIFKATLDNLSIALNDKEQVAKAGNYLAKWLATMATLVDISVHSVAAFCGAILHGEGGK